MDLDPILFPKINNQRPLVIAGPCSAETEEQVLATARQLASHGIRIFRAGIWKPRTKPGGFEGVGSIGLPWLEKVKETTGMYVATEVATRSHVIEASAYNIDILWIGARTSVNPFAVQEIAEALAETRFNGTVFVKNPVNPDLELWIGAIERIYNVGIRKIAAVHRGFSSYDQKVYRNLPHWNIAIELKRQIPSIPLIADPSHIGGKRELIAPLSQQAMDLNYDGLIIEAHCDPDEAWSDINQQITPQALADILDTLIIRDDNQPTENLTELRRQIDQVDEELISVLARRMRLSQEIGRYKKEHNMPVLQSGRYSYILNSRIAEAQSLGMQRSFMQKILEAIHEESIRQQIEVVNSRKVNNSWD